MEKFGFYIVKDEYFTRFSDPNLKGNKEQSRPHYYCFNDDVHGLYWFIPMSGRVSKYRNIIQTKQAQNKPCDGLYICRLSNGRENAFLIQDMLPITDEYVLRPYTFAGQPLILIKDEDRRIIEQKAKRVLNLIQRGKKITPMQADIIRIKEELLNDMLVTT